MFSRISVWFMFIRVTETFLKVNAFHCYRPYAWNISSIFNLNIIIYTIDISKTAWWQHSFWTSINFKIEIYRKKSSLMAIKSSILDELNFNDIIKTKINKRNYWNSSKICNFNEFNIWFGYTILFSFSYAVARLAR